MTADDLAAARARLALSTGDFARLVGARNRSTVTRWENGERSVPESVALLLAIMRLFPEIEAYMIEGRLRAPG